jgi:hypothetical protein
MQTVWSVGTGQQTPDRSNSVLNIIWLVLVDGATADLGLQIITAVFALQMASLLFVVWDVLVQTITRRQHTLQKYWCRIWKGLTPVGTHTTFYRLCLFVRAVSGLFHSGLRAKIL